MRIEADDNNQSIEPNTVLKSIFDRVESVGDTLLRSNRQKAHDFSRGMNAVDNYIYANNK